MKFTPTAINRFLLFKLPSAYLCGVRVEEISSTLCKVRVRHRWINQNPFNSMYFAVQAMAAELSTGALVMQYIGQSKKNISMLVFSNKSSFTKKATGVIHFICNDGHKIEQAIQKTINTQEAQTCWMKAIGVNQKGEQVSEFEFEWTLKVKN